MGDVRFDDGVGAALRGRGRAGEPGAHDAGEEARVAERCHAVVVNGHHSHVVTESDQCVDTVGHERAPGRPAWTRPQVGDDDDAQQGLLAGWYLFGVNPTAQA
ncbi:hypothetical protein GCM10023317_51660 [Actinopolymorpha pittospori]